MFPDLATLKEYALFQSEVLDTLPNPIFVKLADMRFVFFNKAYENAFGMNRHDCIGKTVMDLDYLPLEDRKRYHAEDTRMIREQDTVHRHVDFLFADGEEHHCLYWSSGFRNVVDGVEIHGLVGMIVDISEQKRVELQLAQKITELDEAKRKIEAVSRTDYLTGLSNRRAFMERLREEYSKAVRHKQPLSLMMADLDHFKLINDTYGHGTGDDVLRKVGDILRSHCRLEDIAGRSGGEEFLVLLPMTALEQAQTMANRICKDMRASAFEGIENSVTISIGVVELESDEEPDYLLNRADKALYRAKSKGRDTVSL